MKIEINNITDLQAQLDLFLLKPGASLQNLCRELFIIGENLNEPIVLIKVATELVPPSYIYNSAMFAQNLKRDCPYNYLQSYLKDGKLCIRAGKKKRIGTFRARVRTTLEKHGECIVKRDEKIPYSYRIRPALLANILSRELEQKVCNDCKDKEFVRWFIQPSNR